MSRSPYQTKCQVWHVANLTPLWIWTADSLAMAWLVLVVFRHWNLEQINLVIQSTRSHAISQNQDIAKAWSDRCGSDWFCWVSPKPHKIHVPKGVVSEQTFCGPRWIFGIISAALEMEMHLITCLVNVRYPWSAPRFKTGETVGLGIKCRHCCWEIWHCCLEIHHIHRAFLQMRHKSGGRFRLCTARCRSQEAQHLFFGYRTWRFKHI